MANKTADAAIAARAGIPAPYGGFGIPPPYFAGEPALAHSLIRDRQIYEHDLDRLYTLNKDERDAAISTQGALEKELYATKGVMQSVLAEKEQTEDTLMQVKEAGETLKRQFELALCTSVAERKEYETTVENLHGQMEQQRLAASSKLGSTVEQFETKIAAMTREYETKLSTTVQKYETKIATLQEDHKSQMANTVADHETKYSLMVREYESKLNIMAAEHEAKRMELNNALNEANHIRRDREGELERLRLLMKELDAEAKKRESTLLFELSSAKKAIERLELEKAAAERKVHKVIEESETMRKVFESALSEADSVTKMLREQLEIVRKTMQEQAQQSGREIFALTEELDSAQVQTDRVKLAKYRAESALEEDLAQSNAAAEMERLEKKQVSHRLDNTMTEAERLRTALESSLRESSVLRQELDSAERRAESVQRESEIRIDAIQREKIHTTRQLRDELVTSQDQTNMALREKEVTSMKLRKATDDVAKARFELGSVLKEANTLRMERDDTERLLEVMDSRVDDVKRSQTEIIGDLDHHYGTLTDAMLKSR
jgi:chromosome segregation ATPase